MLRPSAREFLRHSLKADLIIINCDVALAMKLAALYLVFPFLRRPILGHDIVLRKPMPRKAQAMQPFKRFLLSRIDHYSLHFRILDGYRKYFGIDPARVSYLPSKPNRNAPVLSFNFQVCGPWIGGYYHRSVERGIYVFPVWA